MSQDCAPQNDETEHGPGRDTPDLGHQFRTSSSEDNVEFENNIPERPRPKKYEKIQSYIEKIREIWNHDDDETHQFRQEPKKEICSNNRLSILRTSTLIHFPAIATTILLLILYIKRIEWMRFHPTSEELSALQFAAKAHEICIMISLSEMLLYRIRFYLIEGNGIPLGFLTSAFYIPSPFQYLTSSEFWGPVTNTSVSNRLSHLRTAGMIGVLSVIGMSASPLSAIAMIPRLVWWNVGNVTSIGLEDSPLETQYINLKSSYNLTLDQPYLISLSEYSCYPPGSPIGCNSSPQPLLNELYTMLSISPLIPNTANLSSTANGGVDKSRPISFSISESGVSSAVIATSPMKFVTDALYQKKSQLFLTTNSSTDLLINSKPARSSPKLPSGTWRQPLVAVVGSTLIADYTVDGAIPLPSVVEFYFQEATFGNFTVSLDIREELNKNTIKKVGQPRWILVFLDIQHMVPTPLSAAFLLMAYTAESKLVLTEMALYLVKARWIDAETWTVVNESPETRIQLQVPWSDLPSYLQSTTTEQNIIKMSKKWLGGMGTVDADVRQLLLNETFISVWKSCYVGEVSNCFEGFAAAYFTSILTASTQLRTFAPAKDIVNGIISIAPGADDVSIKHSFYRHRYVYSLRNDISIPIALTVLLLHTFIALLHVISIMTSRRAWYSSGWESFGQLLVLALRSRPPTGLHNIGGGVTVSEVWTRVASVREVEDHEQIEMVLDVPEDEQISITSIDDARDHLVMRRIRPGEQYS